MPVEYGTEGHDALTGTAEADVMIGGAGSDTYVINHAGDLVFEDADPDSAAWGGTTAGEPTTLLRTEAGEWCVRIQVKGAPDGLYAEFVLREVSPGVLGVQALRIADAQGQIEEVVLADGDSVWEYAFQLGRETEDGTEAEVEFYGGGHQNQVSRGLGIALDGVDFTALPIGRPVNGVSLSILQDLDILLPTDGTTRAGSVLLQHVFGQSGLTVSHAHDYEEGFVLGAAYPGMLPLGFSGQGGIDWMQIGDGPAQPITYDGSHYYQPGTPTEATAWGDNHNYLVRMALPAGGPDVNADWSRSGESGMWMYDTALDYSKIYINWLDGGRHGAIDTAHVTHYSVELRDSEIPTDVTPLPPRAASQGVDTILSSISLTLPENIEILRLTGSADLSGVGNRANNTLVGNAGANLLDGGGGLDLLYGGAGDDTYVVRDAGTWIEEKAGEGVDSVLTFMTGHVLGTHFENLTYLGRAAFDGTGNASANRMEGGSGADVLRGLDGDDLLAGGAGDDTLVGGLGADHLIGGDGANLLAGDDGDDLLDGRGGGGTLAGGLGDDIFIVDQAGVSIVENLGEGVDEVRTTAATWFLGVNLEILTFTGGGGFSGVGNGLDNRITGGGAGDALFGEGGDDQLLGLEGNDLLAGGAGANLLDGGTGVDNAYYAGNAAGVTVNLSTGSALNAAGGLDTLLSIENVTGTEHADALTGDDLGNVLNGGGGDDVIIGGAGADALMGGAGIDTLSYAAAAARVDVRLHLGQVRKDGDGSADAVSGIENVIGSDFNDLLIGGAESNVFTGGAGADILLGQGGDDVLIGGAGALNTLQGGTGDDWYVLDAADSVHEFEGEGTDTVEARINTHVLATHVENLVFSGSGDFRGTGNDLANVITGAAGDDVLRGGGGVDSLIGGGGGDTADYSLAAAGVVARIDQQRATNDGDGATDIFVSMEHLIGSLHADTLIGDGVANTLSGALGADLLSGGGGDDILSGGSGASNQLYGGTGDDWYILDATDTCVEFAGEGVDTVEARIGNYTLRANIENLIYTGATKFVGAGNELNNVITGGSQNDMLRGGGGDDIIRGGEGSDELQVRGAKADYTITAQGDGWLVVDSVADRDGSTYVESIEVVRFLTGNTTSALAWPPPAYAPGVASTDDGVPTWLGEPPYAEVRSGGKDVEEPLILPREEPSLFLFTVEDLGPSAGSGHLTLDLDNRILVNGEHWLG